MALVGAGNEMYDVDLVIFDKDGTLVDFKAMWEHIFTRQVASLKRAVGASDALIDDLLTSMGVNSDEGRVDPLGPLALATYEEIRVIMAATLYRHGRPWDEATRLVGEVMSESQWPPLEELVRPIGDVAGLFHRLIDAGALIGVVTTDDRGMTETMLRMIGVDGLVSAMACSNDNIPLKPAPDGILALCRQLGVAPSRAMMVGDSPTDMLAAKAASVAARVGVTSGVSRREDLEPIATVILQSIHDLEIEALRDMA